MDAKKPIVEVRWAPMFSSLKRYYKLDSNNSHPWKPAPILDFWLSLPQFCGDSASPATHSNLPAFATTHRYSRLYQLFLCTYGPKTKGLLVCAHVRVGIHVNTRQCNWGLRSRSFITNPRSGRPPRHSLVVTLRQIFASSAAASHISRCGELASKWLMDGPDVLGAGGIRRPRGPVRTRPTPPSAASRR